MNRPHLRRGARPGAVVLVALACAAAMSGATAYAATTAPTSSTSSHETHPYEPGADHLGTDIPAPKSNAPSHVPSKDVPRPATQSVTTDPMSKFAEGLSLKDQRDANGGNSFSEEPPDQALCVGDNQVIEGVNSVFRVYSKSGAAPSPVESYNSFFNNGAVDINRTTGGYGPFVSDPKCYWDPANGHFYMTMLELGTDPKTGAFDGTSYVDIAVTKQPNDASIDPSHWYLYQLDVANSGRTDTTTQSSGDKLANHDGCPCLGDQPLIGADAHGFYITTNEFSLFGSAFNGAQIYALSKEGLANGTLEVQRFESNGPTGQKLEEGTAYSVQPATSPSEADWSSANGGSEYALSSLEFTGGYDNRIARWTLSNTQSLDPGKSLDVHLRYDVVKSEVYGNPPAVTQKAGPYPLGQSLTDKLNLLDGGDDRMEQTVYSGGKLWAGLNTAVKTDNGPSSVGIAYFVVSDDPTPKMVNQGYVAVNRSSVFYPSIGVTPGGQSATMVFSLAGPSYYPSTAYIKLAGSGALQGPVKIYAAGTKPADGYAGYTRYGGAGIERWGDYSAATAGPDGNVWVSTEYIPGTFGYQPGQPTPPSYLANWGTAIGRVAP